MVHPTQQKQLCAERKPLPRLSVTRNGKVRSYTVRPWLAGVTLAGSGLFLAAYICATAYLIYRDDLLGTAVSRQVEMQYAYEERIAALRAELNRVTSRHLVQTEGVEHELSLLLERQDLIERRQSALDGLVEKARATGIDVAADNPRQPRPRPDSTAAHGAADAPIAPLAHAPSGPTFVSMITDTLMAGGTENASHLETRDLQPVLHRVRASLDGAEAQQSDALEALSNAAETEVEKLTTALEPIGIDLGASEDSEPQGGPYIAAAGMHFVERAAILSRTIDDIAALKRQAEAMPLTMPLRAERVSSRYGYRMDPFLKRPAFHAGLDLVAPAGTLVRATAPGTVIAAGWEGGYGRTVEIRHAGGVTTRYAHLSAILVSTGVDIAAGTPVGRVGSTGRSTGPHLHYETGRDGESVNPTIFLAAGRALPNQP
jgi:hypothetical protein